MLRSIRSLCVLTALALATPTLVLAQVPASPVLQASTTGQTVSASWTAVPGATSYRVEAGVTPSLMLAGYEIGPLTSFSIQAPQGSYYLRVLARNGNGVSAPSNVVGIVVQSVVSPAAAADRPLGQRERLECHLLGAASQRAAHRPAARGRRLTGCGPGGAAARGLGPEHGEQRPARRLLRASRGAQCRRPERAVERSADRRERGHLLGACRADPVGAGQRCGRRPLVERRARCRGIPAHGGDLARRRAVPLRRPSRRRRRRWPTRTPRRAPTT